ncbi:hypothetical protein AGABI1DRAFT_112930 [Agaricus bisporus var. burnettii JB137-S8]|uniref:Microbial-type PARG catalytic domain-containing protein n=1 Tax=Agaricus bisporus var. burnettii (strain JB137-S8 / ATCC MYA-4627 / FGSC 10392) TaxID=597362 RepID=K5Y0I3_AGABU|nr:uncharacterized protein AGABI1DRAFT_112930 [Agaricus bisporus var. burnettii JB137-S8]EKM81260.1 hypothetical protein AGABI1DRAFT_112930 [Agaricus bisporus var. burnettii JB137-S8]
MKAIEIGSYALRKSELNDSTKRFDLKSNIEQLQRSTLYYGPESELISWSTPSSTLKSSSDLTPTKIWATEQSSLDTARELVQKFGSEPDSQSAGGVNAATGGQGTTRAHAIGVLNFASARNPGGGFLNGARTQEESIARSSTLYQSLTCPVGRQFYTYHHEITAGKNDGFYSHAMIYSPSVRVFRTDPGDWIEPYEIDILTSPAVNAGVVWQKRQKALKEGKDAISESATESKIRAVMKERMARLLYLFEIQGVRNIVLGSFGTGAFRNSVDMVVGLWAELLIGEEARFNKSFERVVFGVLGNETYLKFADRFGTEAA